MAKHSLALKCFDSPHYRHINNPYQCEPALSDLALSAVDDRWTDVPHSAMAFPGHRLEARHAPIDGGYLFVMGLPVRKRITPRHSMCYSPPEAFIYPGIQEAPESDETRRSIRRLDFDATFHFAMPWHPEATTPTDGTTSSKPLDPHGKSGSFVWNTRIVEFTQRGEPWSPGVARLTGVVWGWDTRDRFLFATRVEHLRALLDEAYS